MTLLGRLFGGKQMTALGPGTTAPQIELAAMDGTKFSLKDALARGPVLAAFFKISCPVCQYAFPFFERIYRAHGGGKVTIVGVSQNEAKDTSQFLNRFGITFPVLLDDAKAFPASNAYGLTTVPSVFWISQDGQIEISSVGWSRADFEAIAQKAAEVNSVAPQPIFQPSEQIADFRAG